MQNVSVPMAFGREYQKWIYSHMSGYFIEPFFEDMIYGE